MDYRGGSVQDARASAWRLVEQRAAARLVDGFSVGELVTVLIIMGACLWIAARDGMVAIQHAKVAEAFILATGPKLAWMERWAIGGEVPGPIPVSEAAVSLNAPTGERPISRYLDAYVPGEGDGGFSFALRAEPGLPAGQRIGFRAVLGPGEVPATVAWICGHRRPPPEMHTLGPDRTTLTNAQLPVECRGP